MYFLLSKTVGVLTEPSNVLIGLAMLGAILTLTRFASSGRRLTLISLVLIAVFGLLPIGNIMMLALDDRFPEWDASRGSPDGIITLGGAINVERSAKRGRPVVNGSFERIIAAAELANRYPSTRILCAGGNSNLLFNSLAEADFCAIALVNLGIDRARIMVETRSRNTAENATYARSVVTPKPGERWLLVTSASHMSRAIGAFRKANFDVEPVPVDLRSGGMEDYLPNVNLVDGLSRVDQAAKEWVGLLVYWLTGRSSELFPGPRRA